MGTYLINPPERDSAPTIPTKSGSGSKNRIYEVFQKTIELDELSLSSNPPISEENSDGQIESTLSLQYPLIKINDYILSETEISKLEINTCGFIPEIILSVELIHQTFLTREMPKDGDIISVAIRGKNSMMKMIRNDYIITGVQTTENTTIAVGPVSMTFFGILFIPWISSSNFNFSHEGTSLETLKKLAKELGLGFATNEDNTDDKQIWFSGYRSLTEFITKVAERSYKDDESFYNIWIDIYYNLNFININKMLLSSEDQVDPAAWLNNIDKDFTYGEKTDEKSTVEVAKVFSNYDIFRTSPFYITTWKPINKSSQISYEVGTKILCNLFEHNDKLYKNLDSEKYWSVPMEPTYDPNKVNQYILLRGRATQNPGMRGKDLARSNYSFPEINQYNIWSGIQYTISNPDDNSIQWDGNHHRNYNKARVQNIINNKELDKLNIEIVVNGINTNLIKGDKTPIVLIKKDDVENRMVSKEAAGNDLLEQFYSGWFYVKGFKIIWDKFNKSSIMSNFRHQFTLTRREWPPPIAVEALPKNENNI